MTKIRKTDEIAVVVESDHFFNFISFYIKMVDKSVEIRRFTSVSLAGDYYKDCRPKMFVIDLELHRVSQAGLELAREFRHTKHLKDVPILITGDYVTERETVKAEGLFYYCKDVSLNERLDSIISKILWESNN